ncbi:glycosyltransferase family 2 protein, partial [Vibrio breoganii]
MSVENLVSILVPVFNREGIIRQTLESALNQTHQNIEVIVVDNHSTDNTWELVREISNTDSRVKCFRNDTNIGPVRNWLKCVEHAKGYYGKILWSDDLIAPTFIEETLPMLGNDVGFVFTNTKIFTDDINVGTSIYNIGPTGYYSVEDYIEGVIFSEDYPASPGCALFRMSDIRRNLLEQIPNNIDSDFSMHAIGNDVLLFLLTCNDYKKFAYIQKELSYFRYHSESISVASSSGKIPLHYKLAQAYYIENYQREMINKLNSVLLFNLIKYRDARKFKMSSIKSFYVTNTIYRIDKVYFLRYITT